MKQGKAVKFLIGSGNKCQIELQPDWKNRTRGATALTPAWVTLPSCRTAFCPGFA